MELTKSTKQAVVLFAHGARNPEWSLPFKTMQLDLASRLSPAEVRLAYLELMEPGLPETLAGLVAEGIGSIVIAPLFLAAGGHIRKDLPQLVADFSSLHPEITIDILPVLGEMPEVRQALANGVASRLAEL